MKILKDYQESTVDSIIANTNLKKIYYTDKQCKAIFTVLKPGAHALFYTKTNTQDLMGLMVRLAGFEIRDAIAIVGNKALFIVARKPLSESTVAANTLKWGTGGLNIDASRVGTEVITQRQITGENNKHIGHAESGIVRKQTGVTTQTTGRFPANIILDEEAAELLDEQNEGASRFFYVAKDNKAMFHYLKTMITPTDGNCLFI
jgi:site-specific DNA-methyltransferase (adenine-specific)